MTVFYIVRHGETLFNTKKMVQGWVDSPLTEKGESQAKEAGNRLKNIEFDHAYSSTQERAYDTLRIMIGQRDIPITQKKGFKELFYGDLEAERQDEIDWVSIRKEHPEGYAFCNGENKKDATDRFFHTMKGIMDQYPDSNVLIVSHGSIIRHVLERIDPYFITCGIHTGDLIGNCSVTIIEGDEDGFHILQYGDKKY
ncbi:MAG: histidine phosphatase family protein [Faecalicoccus sp.]|nr:histidine phosphatase family protein [Faecalicoccus sp.]